MERDIARWYKSFDEAFTKMMWDKWGNLLADFEGSLVGPIGDVHMRWAKNRMRVHSADEMRGAAKEKYKEHYVSVRKMVPRERLLE